MAPSETARRSAVEVVWLVGLPVLLAGLWLLVSASHPPAATAQPQAPNTVTYRYRFGGQVTMRRLPAVAAILTYRHAGQVDQVVFKLGDGRNYVLNGDVLVDFDLAPGSVVERQERTNVLFNHYDPYLQAEKQEMHRQWVDEQYRKWVGRPPTYDEWIAALNELTRGVEHYQMEEWIAYSPLACEHEAVRRLPGTATAGDIRAFCARVSAGATYDEIGTRVDSRTTP